MEFFASEAKGNVCQVGDGDGAMGGLDGCGGLSAVLDGVDEVAKVVFAFVEVDFVCGNGATEFDGSYLEAATCGGDGAAFTFELDAGTKVHFVCDMDGGAIGVLVREGEGERGGVEAAGFRPSGVEVSEGDGPTGVFVERPLNNVEVVGTEVGDVAARVVVEPAPV